MKLSGVTSIRGIGWSAEEKIAIDLVLLRLFFVAIYWRCKMTLGNRTRGPSESVCNIAH
jgi:hypothetical protein